MTDFVWGINTHRSYSVLSVAQQLDVATTIGLTSLRVDVYDATPATIAWLTSLVTEAGSRGITILPVIVPNAAASNTEANAYNWGFATGRALAAAFPSLTWEAGNELDMFAIKPGTSGQSPSDYNDALYNMVRGSISGMYDGIHQADPTAKVVVGIAGIHFGFLERLADDGVNWDITSEHYYAAPAAADIATGADFLFGTLAQFNRPILMTEFNQQQGSLLSQSAQSETLVSMMSAMKLLAPKYNIIGAYLYELLDEPHLEAAEAHYGLATETGVIKSAGLAVQQYLEALVVVPPQLRLVSDTGSSSADLVTSRGMVTGKADALSIVQFAIDDRSIAQTSTTDANGNWTFDLTGWGDGQHTVVANSRSGGALVSSSLSFLLDTKVPLPSVTDLIVAGGLAQMSGNTGGAGDAISFYVGGKLISTTTTDGGGNFSFAAPAAARSTHAFSLVATDIAGNVGSMSGNAYIGSTGSDVIVGSSQRDLIHGGNGNDSLSGGNGIDSIIAGSGADTLYGGNGADILKGGDGKDVYVYRAASDSTAAASDTITDFVHGVDKIDFTTIAGINASGRVPQFQGELAASGNVKLNANSVGFIESGGNTLVLVNTSSAAKIISAANTDSADMKIVLLGVRLGLTATDFEHS